MNYCNKTTQEQTGINQAIVKHLLIYKLYRCFKIHFCRSSELVGIQQHLYVTQPLAYLKLRVEAL